jgi:hypothetical protein
MAFTADFVEGYIRLGVRRASALVGRCTARIAMAVLFHLARLETKPVINLKKTSFALLLGMCVAGACSLSARADVITDAINADATALVTSQTGGGGWTGSWSIGYFGSTVDGLVDAYTATGNASYKTAAINGSDAIRANATSNGGSILGDEAYALARTSSLSGNANATLQYNAVNNFFSSYVPTHYTDAAGLSTALQTSYGADKSQLTIYMSYYTMAAYQLGRTDASQYRAALIDLLNKVTDWTDTGNQSFPVGALGAATWALAQTGSGLDGTVLTGSDNAYNVFGGHTLADLPGMLDARINATSGTMAYLLTDDYYHGFTDDTALGIMGLAAADAAAGTSTYAADIHSMRVALASTVNLGTGNTSNFVAGTTASGLSGSMTGKYFSARALEGLSTPGVEIQPVPEPASLGLLGATALLLVSRRRKQA